MSRAGTERGARHASEVLLNPRTVNLISVAAAVVLGMVSVALYVVVHGEIGFVLGSGAVWAMAAYLVVVLLLIGLHELVHGWSYRLLGGVDTRYSVDWKHLMVLASALGPMPIRAYRWSVAMPTLVIAAPLYLAGLVLGVPVLYITGFLMLVCGTGDAAILWSLRKVPPGTLVQDHPTKPGCTVWEGASCAPEDGCESRRESDGAEG